MFSSVVFPDRKFLKLHALAQSLFAKRFHIYLFCVSMWAAGWVPKGYGAYSEVRGQPTEIFSSILWVLGIKIKWSGLSAGAFSWVCSKPEFDLWCPQKGEQRKLTKLSSELGVVAHTFNPSWWISGFEAILVYKGNSKTVKDTD